MEVDEITPTGAVIQDEQPVVPVVDETVIEPKAETDGETPEDTSTPGQTFTQEEVELR